ncbi:MAG: cell division protein ZapA [Prevotellaceae bacterium]|jgi:hypothetical protein|nr:cell division protein ZapA [Prevotellaceae bacterium]
MSDGEVAANINIAGRIYQMRVAATDEEILRKAEALIKNGMRYYDIFPDKDTQDRLAVMLLNMTARLLEYQKLNDSCRSEIERIDRELGVYLDEQGSLDNME